ncbi:MAG: tetratricopeptide repeat protein [Sphingomonadaceae bacterium]|nr:tetratricopeptide repeat protein [Sphingomonadaceae bacterium]
MSWLPILLLGAIAFVLAAFVLRLPRAGWSILGAALMLGLAGYALQGHPGYAGAPKAAPDTMAQTGAAMVDARRQMFDPDQPAGEWITVADGFARNGDYEQAAGFLRAVIQKNPRDGEAWLALGNALVEHANGMLTPAALYAYEQADRALPGHPGPTYFLGVALVRSGRLAEARSLWLEALEKAPADAPWRESLQERITRLEELMVQMGAQ